DVHRGEFEMRRLEIRAAGIERLLLQRGDEPHQPADRIVRALRIRDVALRAADDQRAVERAAPPDLDRIAERGLVARLAENAVVEFFAVLRGPLQELR